MNPAIQLIKQLKKRHKLDDAYEVLVEVIDRLYKEDDFAGIDEILFLPPSEFGMSLSVAILAFTWAFQDRLRYYNYFLNRVRERALLRDDPKLEDLLLNFERSPRPPRSPDSFTTGSMQYRRLGEQFDLAAPLSSRGFDFGYGVFVEALENGDSVREARQVASDAVEIYEAAVNVFSRLGLPPLWIERASRFVALRGLGWLD